MKAQRCEIEVTFDADAADEEDVDDDGDGRRAGLKRIPSSSGGVTIEEKNNKVEVGTDWSNEEIYSQDHGAVPDLCSPQWSQR